MVNESPFTQDVWKTWLEPFHAVRMLVEAGLDDREHAVNWLKGCLRRGELRAGGTHIELLPGELIKHKWVYGRYKASTWTNVAVIPWKDDFWVSGNYEPNDPLDSFLRSSRDDEFEHHLYDVRFEPALITQFCERAGKSFATFGLPAAHPLPAKGGRPPKPFWDRLWAFIAAQLHNGDLQPKRQADIERAMHDWIVASGEEAGETAVRAKAKLLWDAIQTEVEN